MVIMSHKFDDVKFITLDAKVLELRSKMLSTSYARISIHK